MESRNSIISIVLNAFCYSIGNFLRPLPTHYQQYRCYCFSLLIICVKRGQLSADYIIVYSATGLNSGWFEYYVLYLVFFYVTSYKSSFCRRYLLLLFMKRSCLFQKVVSLFLWLWFYIKLFFYENDVTATRACLYGEQKVDFGFGFCHLTGGKQKTQSSLVFQSLRTCRRRIHFLFSIFF